MSVYLNKQSFSTFIAVCLTHFWTFILFDLSLLAPCRWLSVSPKAVYCSDPGPVQRRCMTWCWDAGRENRIPDSTLKRSITFSSTWPRHHRCIWTSWDKRACAACRTASGFLKLPPSSIPAKISFFYSFNTSSLALLLIDCSSSQCKLLDTLATRLCTVTMNYVFLNKNGLNGKSLTQVTIVLLTENKIPNGWPS